MHTTYPKKHFTNTEMNLKTFIDNISDLRQLIESLIIDNEQVNFTENKTKNPADRPASICNKLHSVKSNKVLYTLAHIIVSDSLTKNCNVMEKR